MPLRFLRLKHNNVRQNITYSCDSGVDGFTLVQLLAANGDTLTFNDKTIRMISQVRASLHGELHTEAVRARDVQRCSIFKDSEPSKSVCTAFERRG